MKNALREKLISGSKGIGTFFEAGSTIMAECLSYSSFDFMIIDTEHGPFETESVMEFISAAKGKGLTPLVRTKDSPRSSLFQGLRFWYGERADSYGIFR